jgi:hypothetical protein
MADSLRSNQIQSQPPLPKSDCSASFLDSPTRRVGGTALRHISFSSPGSKPRHLQQWEWNSTGPAFFSHWLSGEAGNCDSRRMAPLALRHASPSLVLCQMDSKQALSWTPPFHRAHGPLQTPLNTPLHHDYGRMRGPSFLRGSRGGALTCLVPYNNGS